MHAGCCARQIGSGEGRRGRIRRSYTVGILARRAAAMALATSDVDVVPDGSGKPGYCVCSHVERCGSAVVLSRSWESVVVGIHANSEEMALRDSLGWIGWVGRGGLHMAGHARAGNIGIRSAVRERRPRSYRVFNRRQEVSADGAMADSVIAIRRGNCITLKRVKQGRVGGILGRGNDSSLMGVVASGAALVLGVIRAAGLHEIAAFRRRYDGVEGAVNYYGQIR